MQRRAVVSNPAAPISAAARRAASTPSLRIDGVELELTGKPLERLTVHFAGAYTLAQYVKYVTDGVDVSGQPFESTPKFQGDLSVSYVYPVNFGSITGTGDVAYQSKINLDPEDGSIFTNNYTTQGAYALLNGRVSAYIDKYDVEIGAWVRNLTDRKYKVAAVDLLGTPTGAPSLGVGSIYLSQPRTFGFDATWHF
jgi:outer membrane receptor protein involved in Fe transport